MQNKFKLPTKFLVVVLFLTMHLGHTQSLWDMLYNKSYDFNNYVKKHTSEKKYLQGTIEITQYSFKNQSLELYPTLNQKVFETCINSLEDEFKYRILLQKALDKLEVLNKVVNSRNSRYYEDNLSKLNPKLSRIEIEVVSIVGQKVCYQFSYEFDIASREVKQIEVKDYYWGDLTTATLVKMDRKPSESQIKSIEDKAFQQFNEQFLLASKNLNLEDLDDYNEELEERPVSKPLENQGNVYHKIQLKDADFLWIHHGILIQIQDYASTTETIQGRGLTFFIPYHEALPYLKWIPELAFIAQIPVVRNEFQNWNEPNFVISKFFSIKSEPNLLDLMKHQNSNQKQKIKQLQQTSFQVFKNGERKQMNRNVYQFDGNQKLLWQETFDDQDKTYSKTFYDYDAKQNLISTTVKLRAQKDRTTQFQYDAKGNLLRKRTSESQEITDTHYFYNQNAVYSFSHQIFGEVNRTIAHVSLYKDKFCTDHICYLLNSNGDVIGVQSQKYISSQAQIGRDANGLLREAHFDNDRYHYYFDYNDQQFLTHYMVFEYAIQKNEIQWFYEDGASIPYKITKLNSSYDTVKIEELITWEGF